MISPDRTHGLRKLPDDTSKNQSTVVISALRGGRRVEGAWYTRVEFKT